MTLSPEDRFNLEVLKLLARLAWADQSLSEQECHVIRGLGRSWAVPEGELHTLMERLTAGGGSLPEPDLEVLRTRPDDVLEAARALSLADGKLAAGEKSLIESIRARLGSAPRG